METKEVFKYQFKCFYGINHILTIIYFYILTITKQVAAMVHGLKYNLQGIKDLGKRFRKTYNTYQKDQETPAKPFP